CLLRKSIYKGFVKGLLASSCATPHSAPPHRSPKIFSQVARSSSGTPEKRSPSAGDFCMLRFPALAVALLSCVAVLSAATNESDSKSQPAATVHGVVEDPTGAIVPNAQVSLVDADGAVA